MRFGISTKTIGTALAAVLVAAAWQARHKEVVLLVATRDEVSPALRAALGKYQNEHSKVAVDIVPLSESDLYSEEKASLDGRREPPYDVMLVDSPWLDTFSESKAGLYPQVIREDNPFVPGPLQYVATPCPAGAPAGHCYAAAPYVGNAQFLCYNRKVISQPPDCDGLKSYTAKAAKGAGYVLRGSSDLSDVTDDFMPIYWGSKDDVAAAVASMQAFASAAPLSFLTFGSFEVQALILRGTSPMGLVWSQGAMQMEAQDGKENLGFAAAPCGVSELGVWYLAIPGNARHRDLALSFIADAIGKDAMRRAIDESNPPTRKDLLQDPELVAQYPSFPAQLKALETSRSRPTRPLPSCRPDWKTVEDQIGGSLRDMYLGRVTAEDAAISIKASLERCNSK
jgi:ABC-type glycerol-3-phosphate transport system substrate-binding protein